MYSDYSSRSRLSSPDKQVAVAVAFFCYFFFMIYAGANYFFVFFLISCYSPTRTVSRTEFFFSRQQTPHHPFNHLLVGIQFKALLFGIFFTFSNQVSHSISSSHFLINSSGLAPMNPPAGLPPLNKTTVGIWDI